MKPDTNKFQESAMEHCRGVARQEVHTQPSPELREFMELLGRILAQEWIEAERRNHGTDHRRTKD